MVVVINCRNKKILVIQNSSVLEIARLMLVAMKLEIVYVLLLSSVSLFKIVMRQSYKHSC